MPARYDSRTLADQRSQTSRWPKIMAIALVTGALLASAYGILRLLPSRWQQSLETCDQAEIVPRLHRLIDMKPDGLRRVTDSLRSEREAVALGAAKVLKIHLAHWERLPPHVGREKAALVAAEVARHVSEFRPNVQQAAARLAESILRWPSDPTASNRAILVAHCDAILQAAERGTDATRKTMVATTENISKAGANGTPHSILTSSEQIFPATPGSGLPIDLPHEEASIESVEERPPTIAGPTKSLTTSKPTARRNETAVVEPPRLMPEPNGAADSFRPPPQPLPSVSTDLSPAPNQPARLPVDSNLLAKLWSHPESLSNFELLGLAQSNDRQTSKRAWEELHTREIPPKFLELGLHLTNPDPAIRRQWSQRLPSVPGIDARPWLLALSNDVDAEVRMNALVLMATMGDPRLLRRIEQIARDDREPQIQDQARRILAAE